MEEALAARLAQRQANVEASALGEDELRQRDSSLKKITPFLKKLKERLGEECGKLTVEIPKLNLSKYVEEVATGVVEAKVKLADVPAVVELCSIMHQSYPSFTPALQPQLLKLASAPAPVLARGTAGPAESDADRTARLVRKRSLLRLAFDLFTAGIIKQAGHVIKLVQIVCAEDASTTEPVHPYLSIVTAVAKHICNDPLLLAPSAIGEGEAPPTSGMSLLSSTEQAALLKHLREYTDGATTTLHATHAQLLRLERANQKVLLNKGELSDESLAMYERVHKLHEKLVTGVGALCEALSLEAPVLSDDKEQEKEKLLVSMHGPGSDNDGLGLFEDEDQRTLYEQLPDLKAVLPAVLFADPKDGKDDASTADEIDQLLARLPHVTTREQIDSLASELVCAGGRLHVRRILRALLQPPRTRHVAELTPLYARLVAILAPGFRHLASELSAALIDEFEQGRHSNNPRDLPMRIANVQYIAELIKFRVLPSTSAFKCLKDMLEDLNPSSVQVVCSLLEGCGRFLYRQPDTRERCEGMLDLLVKMRSVHRLPSELSTLIDNAICTCRPPERSAIVEEVRPPLQRYVVWLLHAHLSRNSVERVIKQLRKLDWADPAVCEWVHSAVLDCASVKFHIIHLVSCVISGLAKYHEAEMLRLVDVLVERVRLSVELNDFREAQKRVCLVKLLGELYNYQLIDSSVIFRTLNQLVPRDSSTWGYVIPLPHVSAHAETEGAAPAARPLLHEKEPMRDGPLDTGRLRLVCVLLSTCGQFFCRGSAKRKLDVFLVHLLRYAFCKALGPDIEFTLTDTLAMLRPKLVRPTSYAEATSSVQQLQAMLATDSKKGEALAHELLHSSLEVNAKYDVGCSHKIMIDPRFNVPSRSNTMWGNADAQSQRHMSQASLGIEGTEEDDGEEQGEEDEADARGELGEEGDEGDEDDAMEAELAEVERQLRDLEVDDEGEPEASKEEEEAFIDAQKRREATAEEKDAFEREMQAMLSDTREGGSRKNRVDAEGIKIPLNLFRSSVTAQNGLQGASARGSVTLRVLKKGAKNKMEASEVHVPADDVLAKTVLRMEDKAAEERQRLKERVLAAAADHESGSSRTSYIAKIQQSPILPEVQPVSRKGTR